MFKYLACALALVAGSVFCFTVAHADDMMAMPSDSYSSPAIRQSTISI